MPEIPVFVYITEMLSTGQHVWKLAIGGATLSLYFDHHLMSQDEYLSVKIVLINHHKRYFDHWSIKKVIKCCWNIIQIHSLLKLEPKSSTELYRVIVCQTIFTRRILCFFVDLFRVLKHIFWMSYHIRWVCALDIVKGTDKTILEVG